MRQNEYLWSKRLNLDKEVKHFSGFQTIWWVSSQYKALEAVLNNYNSSSSYGTDQNAAKAELKTNRFLVFFVFYDRLD